MTEKKKDICISFEIDHFIWKNILENNTKIWGKRKCLQYAPLNNYLTKLLQTKDVKCIVKCKYNWFKEENSRKQSSSYWRGTFYCQTCTSKFVAIIQNDPFILEKSVFININYSSDQSICQNIIKDKKCSGEQRVCLANEIMSKGYTKLKSENTIYNTAFPDNDRNYFL